MAFDKTQPAPNISLRLSNPLILANWEALEDALGREHDFPGTMGSTAGQHKYVTLADQGGDPETPAAGKSILYAKSGLPYQRNSAGTVIRVMIGEGGGVTKCWFFQDTAPIGWSIVSGCEDALLAVKGGENAYNVAGGTKLAGTWSHVAVENAGVHSHTVGNHVHAGPSHSHNAGSLVIASPTLSTYSLSYFVDGVKCLVDSNGDIFAPYRGGGLTPVNIAKYSFSQAISGSTGAGGTGNTGGAAPATDSQGTHSHSVTTGRPLANVGIIASLN